MVDPRIRFDGILGLAYDTISVNHITPPFYSMINQGLIDEPVFAFRLGESEADGGEATFGGVDNAAYTGNIDYVPLRRKAYWEVELEKVAFGSDVLELDMTGAAIDTGKSPVNLIHSNFSLDRTQVPPSSPFPLTLPKCSIPKLVPPSLGMANIKWTVLKSLPFPS